MTHIAFEKISVWALVLLITGAIDSIRNLAGAALFGTSLVFFFIFSAVVFLIPVALISAELASTWSEEEGGIYSWVKHAFGENVAFFTIWLQWVNTLVWYPTILSFIAGTLAYLLNPALAQNKLYMIGVIVTLFWSMTGISLLGLRSSARFAGVCALSGMILPILFMVGLCLSWLLQGKPTVLHFTATNWLPHWQDSQSWVSLTAIMTSFLGMELAAVHVRNVHNPQDNFPRAMLLSVVLILFTMVLGSLAIAFVLPQHQINLVYGAMSAFQVYLQAYHLEFLMPLMVFLLLLGSVGSMTNWIISPAKGLLMAAQHGFLPASWSQLNKKNMPSRILIVQAVVVTLLCSGFLLLPSVNAIYWLFTDLSTELYMLMYVLMFIAAIRLKYRYAHHRRRFSIPGGKLGYYTVCLIGLLGALLTLWVGFIPPSKSIDIGGEARFRLIFSAGIVVMLLPALGIYLWKLRFRRLGSLPNKIEEE